LNNRTELVDAEKLVEACYLAHAKEITYIHASKNSNLDWVGIDFIVSYKPWAIAIKLQVSISSNQTTIGVVQPLPKELPSFLRRRISLAMADKMSDHARKHSDCFIFVARPESKKDEEAILRDIWRETLNIFKEVRKRRTKKKKYQKCNS